MHNLAEHATPGPAATNLEPSRRRAGAVAGALYARGVSRDQLIVEGRGVADPIADNATPEGRRANRRVEFIRTR